jgi:hypothetical protein
MRGLCGFVPLEFDEFDVDSSLKFCHKYQSLEPMELEMGSLVELMD